eukprot:scaffold12981_cov142-Isochrysis_galbana.AAC.2
MRQALGATGVDRLAHHLRVERQRNCQGPQERGELACGHQPRLEAAQRVLRPAAFAVDMYPRGICRGAKTAAAGAAKIWTCGRSRRQQPAQ